MSDVPVDAPDHCPGPQSESAGRASSCAGCPNQAACSSGQAKLPLTLREPEVIAAIRRRLGMVRYKVLILSGKGGVGKSSVSVCLARGLCRRPRDKLSVSDDEVDTFRVGLLDLDLCGPSTPCMLGCMEAQVHQSQSGWSPVFVSDNLSVMSVGFLLPGPDYPVIWRGPRKNVLIRQLLSEVCWNDDDSEELDFLLIDTPPGTSDEHLSVVQYLQAADCLDGAVIVTTPQEVALSDVRKEISFCHKLSIPILGLLENMTEFLCPNCGHSAPVFPPTTGGAISLCSSFPEVVNHGDKPPTGESADIPLLGRLPLDPRLARALDEGLCPFELADSNATRSGQSDEGSENNLRPSDAVLIAYNHFIDSFVDQLTRLRKKTRVPSPTVVDAETGERQDIAT